MIEWHLITGEYPPQPGGVSDYSRLVAAGLADLGDSVHVWCPPAAGATVDHPGVTVHREMGTMSPASLRHVGKLLDRHPAPRRLLVQWSPPAFGPRAINLPFCLWLLSRARRSSDQIYLMVHEAYMLLEGSWKQRLAALIQRAMSIALLQAAERVWVGTPEWGERLRPYRLGRRVRFRWLPVPSNIPRVDDAAAVERVRAEYAPDGSRLVGHFGTYGRLIAPLLDELLPEVLARGAELRVLLLGRGAAEYRAGFAARFPELSDRLVAPVYHDDRELSLLLSACDLFVQPYPEGVNARRGSAMAVMGHARPMITNRGAYTESVWEKGAHLIDGPDMRLLARACLTVARDGAHLAELTAAAEQVYDDHFDLRHTVAAFHESAGPTQTSGSRRRVEAVAS